MPLLSDSGGRPLRRQLRKGPGFELFFVGLPWKGPLRNSAQMDLFTVLGLLGLLGLGLLLRLLLLGNLAPASSKIFTIPRRPSCIATSMGYTGSIWICDLV